MRHPALLPFALAFLCAGSARAGVIYTNFGPGDSYHTDSGTFINDRPSLSFTAGPDQALSEVDVAVSLYDSSSTNQLTISLAADSSGHPAASPLVSMVFTGALTLAPAILQWTLTTPFTLNPNDTWWISLDAAPGNVIWNYNDQQKAGGSRFGSGLWTAQPGDTQGAIRILATTVPAGAPEPATCLLSAGALAALLFRARRNRPQLPRQNTLPDDAPHLPK